jgi:glycosyltransferase involved in cell wall biosynthesis
MPGIEAAACRCPLVSTRCGGPEDYIEEGKSGYLVDVGDSNKIAERIKKIVELNNDDWCTMSEASYSISLKFDWDVSAGIMEKALFDELDKNKSIRRK